jgi:hypothetical protein
MTIVKFQLANRSIVDCIVEISLAPPWELAISGPGPVIGKFRGEDLFEALITLRAELEKTGQKILCSGSRVDVFPSGMSRSMAGGRKAYVMELGLPATELVDILDYADPESIGSIEQQRQFHQEWIKSIKIHPEIIRPTREEIETAQRNPNGWVYRIAGHFDSNASVPPSEIIGAWKVDRKGKITGGFIKNNNYKPKQ